MHVHIVDDEPELLTSLSVILRRAGHEVTCFSNARAFLAVARDLTPGCVLLDLHLPDINGLTVQRELVRMDCGHAVILLTGVGEIPDAVSAMRAGALDFIRKPYRAAELLEAVTHAEQAVAAYAEKRARAQRFAALNKLSTREREVLSALAGGGPSKTVAYDLGISVRTVEMHRANILKKLDVPNIGAALLMAQAGAMLSS
ncbi:response regulator [Sphingomonas sp.]|uniref:response regulator transcription factor n=1 Tax=Sphingomonas sp. TaxID=28214 RepID=UPI001DD4DB59|nr:response regulator [Sphingomonas sp.]MBX9795782.1 response regulator [Sphingomonas sp.]